MSLALVNKNCQYNIKRHGTPQLKTFLGMTRFGLIAKPLYKFLKGSDSDPLEWIGTQQQAFRKTLGIPNLEMLFYLYVTKKQKVAFEVLIQKFGLEPNQWPYSSKQLDSLRKGQKSIVTGSKYAFLILHPIINMERMGTLNSKKLPSPASPGNTRPPANSIKTCRGLLYNQPHYWLVYSHRILSPNRGHNIQKRKMTGLKSENINKTLKDKFLQDLDFTRLSKKLQRHNLCYTNTQKERLDRLPA
ncbi:hypothetical protein QTO34_016757 [Cnephaeus nilssonii]|uniref:Uncharacterized protein n=1 Tax=Cnephaeus nilssonii TaxID=3371016 RepID=A0AA40I2Z5_CNENI|nr:hypothetical protein QTO34_016757 [Eptesicus nilssonii]